MDIDFIGVGNMGAGWAAATGGFPSGSTRLDIEASYMPAEVRGEFECRKHNHFSQVNR
ncbi:MAG: hypothetical protein V3R80_07900 [Candidatus Tectomicrobia bacterium]